MSSPSYQASFGLPPGQARKLELSQVGGATVRTARDINRRLVLNLIRKHQPISRADLARHSRLQRSTVSAITEQLIAERWVTMGALENIPRGRKPTFLHLNGDRAAILGINVRPTETCIAVADLNLRFLAQETMPTSEDPKQFINDLCKRIHHIVRSHSWLAFEGIGVVLPGRVDLGSGRLVFAPNLAWRGVDLKTPLEEATGLSVELENAANACALAEFSGGKNSEHIRNLITVTVSEGIGVGIFLNGQLVRGSGGLAGEFGHVSIQEHGPQCSCGKRGCLEACASNTAAVRYFSELTTGERGRKSAADDFDAILRLAEKGDAQAGKALERMAQCLGTGLAILITGLAPEVIVLIGELTRAWERVGPIIEATVGRCLVTESHTRIIPSDSRTQPRLRGAIALVMQKYFGAPQIA